MRIHLRRFLVLMLLCCCKTASANPILLGQTTIGFSASGTPNTIAGTWTAAPISILQGATVEYFRFGLTELSSPFGTPDSIGFANYVPNDGVGLALCRNPLACAAEPDIGSFSSASYSPWGNWQFLNRLIQGQEPSGAIHNMGISYSSGGGFTTASGQLLVEVYGLAPASAVPEPPILTLMISALGLLVAMRLRSKEC